MRLAPALLLAGMIGLVAPPCTRSLTVRATSWTPHSFAAPEPCRGRRQGVQRPRGGSSTPDKDGCWDQHEESIRSGERLVRCLFEVQMDPTGCPGDAVVLLGSSNALRNWDAANAIQLQQLRPLDRSWWSAVVDEAVGTEIEFKFAVRSITTGALTWEELKENRAFVIPDQRNPVLSCVFAEPPIYLSFDHSDLPSTAGFGSLVPRVSSDVARAAAAAARALRNSCCCVGCTSARRPGPPSRQLKCKEKATWRAGFLLAPGFGANVGLLTLLLVIIVDLLVLVFTPPEALFETVAAAATHAWLGAQVRARLLQNFYIRCFHASLQDQSPVCPPLQEAWEAGMAAVRRARQACVLQLPSFQSLASAWISRYLGEKRASTDSEEIGMPGSNGFEELIGVPLPSSPVSTVESTPQTNSWALGLGYCFIGSLTLLSRL